MKMQGKCQGPKWMGLEFNPVAEEMDRAHSGGHHLVRRTNREGQLVRSMRCPGYARCQLVQKLFNRCRLARRGTQEHRDALKSRHAVRLACAARGRHKLRIEGERLKLKDGGTSTRADVHRHHVSTTLIEACNTTSGCNFPLKTLFGEKRCVQPSSQMPCENLEGSFTTAHA